MPVSKGCSQSLLSPFQFRWVPNGMKYLGIRLSPDLTNIIAINVQPLLQKMKINLDKWKLLNLTLWGKINTVKMLVAPQFNYVSMMIPIIIDNTLLKQYNGLIKEFLWNGKRARIGIRKLTNLREYGGLALPDLELYNLAFEMNKLSKHWKDEASNTGWIKIEKVIAAPFNIIQLLSQKSSNLLQQNPILQHSQWAWTQIHKRLGISPYKQMYSSVWNNPLVCIGKSSFLWRKWLEQGVQKIEHLYREDNFMTFTMLKEMFNLTDKGDFWKYLQIRSIVGSVFSLNQIQRDNYRIGWIFQVIFNQHHCFIKRFCLIKLMYVMA